MRLTGVLTLLLFSLPVAVRAGPAEVKVEVKPDGRLIHGGKTLGKVPLPPKPWKVELKHPLVGGRKLIHVLVRGGGGRTAELLTAALAPAAPIFAGVTGPQGVDGEWSRRLKVDSCGVLLFQGLDRAVNCDGVRAQLFTRLYDFDQGRFRPVSPRPGGDALPVIKAQRKAPGVPAGAPMNSFRLLFASTQLGDGGRAARLGPPILAADRDPATAWSEGLGGAGRGELFIARAQDSLYRLKALRIIPGDARDRKSFRRSNRLKSATLVLSKEERYRVIFPVDPLKDSGGEQEPYWIIFPRPVATRCAGLVLGEVYPGSLAGKGRGGRTAISELAFYTEVEFGAGKEQLLGDLASDDRRRRDAASGALIRMGADGVKLVVGALKGAPAGKVEAYARVLMASPSPAALAPLAGLQPRLSRAGQTLAMDALERGGEATVTAVVPLLLISGVDEGLVVRLAPLLGKLGGLKARDGLLGLAGQGSEAARAALVMGLSRLRASGDAEAVVDAALAGEDGNRRADLIMAAGLMPGAPARGKALAASLAGLWRPEASFEVRFRLLSALGRLDPDSQLDLLLEAARDKDPALRWTAVDQLRRTTQPRATAALGASLADPDPRVRASAALGMGQRELQQEHIAALIRGLAAEKWGMVAGQLADALGGHCTRAGVKGLREALRHGPRGHAVDRRALESMTRCKPKGLGKFLLAMAGERRWRTGMRTRALASLNQKLALPLAEELAQLMDRLRRDAARSEADEQVAVAAAGTLGAMGGKTAAAALADTLALEPIPSIRLAAALALGSACHPSTRKTLEQAAQDAPTKVMQGAKNSLARCKSRWKTK